jgi:DNA invertase Pin-like site-specific DNA recombinase
VSITQSFNTTSSMGRLTLNVLLSFAQFEREVIGERVRDKIAASKRKGLWIGGPVPLGYRCLSQRRRSDGALRCMRHSGAGSKPSKKRARCGTPRRNS